MIFGHASEAGAYPMFTLDFPKNAGDSSKGKAK
jgi:hypothetical protein